MIKRLQTRLLITMIGLVVIAIGLVALFASTSTRRQFETYLERDAVIDLDRVAQLIRQFSQNQNTAELQALVDEIGRTYEMEAILFDKAGTIVVASAQARIGETMQDVPFPEQGLALQLTNTRDEISTIHFFDEQGSGVGDVFLLRDDTLPGRGTWVRSQPSDEGVFVPQSNHVITRSFSIPISPTLTGGPLPEVMLLDSSSIQESYFNLVSRSFWLAMVVSVLVAGGLGWFTSRRIMRPVRALTTATQQMGRGNLAVRVAIQGDDELAELGHSFNQMAEDLARQEQLRRNLVTDVAHELLTPLATLRGYVEAMQDGVVTASPEILASLHEEVVLLDHLIADLQDLSLAEAGRLPLHLEDVAPERLLMQAVAAARPPAQAKNITLITQVDPSLPPIQADPYRMGQVLRNLLANAIRHTGEGGAITVAAAHRDDHLLIRVTDTGPGIPVEHLPHLFDRFYRVDSSRARGTGGAGLGLAIVKGLVEMHRGRVWVESQVGVGTTFFILLPVTQVKKPHSGHTARKI
jgi:signal transduction histidine kinase